MREDDRKPIASGGHSRSIAIVVLDGLRGEAVSIHASTPENTGLGEAMISHDDHRLSRFGLREELVSSLLASQAKVLLDFVI